MTRTSIELSEATKDRLRDERLDHETNYDQTIRRLLGDGTGDFTTEGDVRGIVADMVVAEALE